MSSCSYAKNVNEKRKYRQPELEVIPFNYCDVIRTSACSGDCIPYCGGDTGCPDHTHMFSITII